jgi:hypothetical protein
VVVSSVVVMAFSLKKALCLWREGFIQKQTSCCWVYFIS